jgi:Leu/Phe-tRNA-protein transferase
MDDLQGIKNALKFLIEREMVKDTASVDCRMRNQHLYECGDELPIINGIKKRYESILDGLK